jgi:hypothetical protein
MIRASILAIACGACAGPVAPAASAPPAAPRGSPSCTAPAFRQLDFWIGDWDVTVHARSAPTSDQWADARGHQHVEAILGGCAISERFTAEGPPTPWAGASYSMWQPALGAWRQTWVDDSGSYLAFQGGLENGAFTLYGEPREVNGAQIQKRMVFREVTATSLRWSWEQSDDHWATATPLMRIDYRRSPATAVGASRP